MDIESTFSPGFSSKEDAVSVPIITLSSYDVTYIRSLDMSGLGHTVVKQHYSKPAHDKIDSVVLIKTQLVTTV